MTYFKNSLPKQLCAAALCLFSTALWADTQPAATTLFVDGTVTAESAAHGMRELEQKAAVFERDQIDTHSDGRAQLRFTDGGLVSLMPDTLFAVEEYFYENEDEGALVFGLLKGGLRTMTGAVGKNKHEQYELKTPVATLGIRGTEYIAVLNPPNTLRVHVGRGRVVLTNDEGEVELSAGQSGIVVQGQAPAQSEEPPVFEATGPGTLSDPERFLSADPFIEDHLRDFPEITVEGDLIAPELDDSGYFEPGGSDHNDNEICVEYPEEC